MYWFIMTCIELCVIGQRLSITLKSKDWLSWLS